MRTHKFLCSFCRSCGQRDYYYRGRLHTDFEEERLREKKGKMYVFPIIGGPPQREKKYCVRNKNETVLKYATMKFFDFS